MGYGVWLHGEAVAAGTVLAAQMSQRLGWINADDVARTVALLQAANLPVVAPQLGVETYLDLMGLDKKVKDGKIRLILLKAVGQAIFTADYPAEALRATLASIHGDSA
jgi:3-dehydroquinate synthase